uniref:Solute carrier family 2, facilitated glucose transporter member 1 n=1 Tax=Ceratitis capitata TaxID=7213 RepID=W8C4K9_CERCA
MTFWADRPQTIAVIPDAFIFLTSGMNLALSLGWYYNSVSSHFQFAWFVGIIIGALLSAGLTQILIKRYFVLLSSFLVVVAGILYTACPYESTVLLVARYLNGIGTGLITVPFIVHCSEISATAKRGFTLGLEQLCVALGIFIQVTYIALWDINNSVSPTRVHGIFCLGFGLGALGLAYLVIESPVYYVRQANDAEALNSLTCLQLPTILTEEKKLLLQVHKDYVTMNEYIGRGDSFINGLGPLLRMIFYRGLLAFTFSLPYSMQLYFSTAMGVSNDSQWTSPFYAAIRILGVLAAISMFDIIGRKLIGLIGLLVMGGLGIGIAVIFAYMENWVQENPMRLACVLLLVFQLFAGLYAPTTTVYLGEAFPMIVKPYFVALCVCVECTVHIVVICTFTFNLHEIYVFNTFTYALVFACFLLFLFTIPETKLTTLNDAQERFRAWIHIKFM